MKNGNSLAKGVIAVGAIVTMLALLWWHSFFRSLAQQYDPSLGEGDPTLGHALVCIAYSTPTCGNAVELASAEGATPYNPWLFWLGIGISIAGIMLRARETDAKP